jgi:membrane protein DedA with SNARE-associated domain
VFTTRDLLTHGYLALFIVALLERMGLPLVLTPFIIAAGAMAGAGWMSLALIILVTSIPAVAVDSGWYWLGRKKGLTVLNFICRLSLERDSCVRRTQAYTAKHAGLGLLYSKFVPGISILVPAMSGMASLRFLTFLLWEILGTLSWTVLLSMIGYISTRGVHWPSLSTILLGYVPAVIGLWVVGNIAWKYTRRQLFIRSLRAVRITPEELKSRLGNDDLIVIDLRHSLDVLYDPRAIPGAIHIYPEDLPKRAHEIPLDKIIVLYCT